MTDGNFNVLAEAALVHCSKALIETGQQVFTTTMAIHTAAGVAVLDETQIFLLEGIVMFAAPLTKYIERSQMLA